MSEAPRNGGGTGLRRVLDTSIADEARFGEGVLIAAYGELDLHVAPELQDRIDTAIAGGATLLVLDLSAVTFVDSMVLGVLLGAFNRMRRRAGDLRLVVPSPELRRIFEISLLDRVFSIEATREGALAHAVDSRLGA